MVQCFLELHGICFYSGKILVLINPMICSDFLSSDAVGLIKQTCLLLSTAVFRADPGGTATSSELWVLFTSSASESSSLLTLWLISPHLYGIHTILHQGG